MRGVVDSNISGDARPSGRWFDKRPERMIDLGRPEHWVLHHPPSNTGGEESVDDVHSSRWEITTTQRNKQLKELHQLLTSRTPGFWWCRCLTLM